MTNRLGAHYPAAATSTPWWSGCEARCYLDPPFNSNATLMSLFMGKRSGEGSLRLTLSASDWLP